MNLRKRKPSVSNSELASNEDVRCELFEAIPEPLTTIKTYQKVMISDTGEPANPDTQEARQKIKHCMAIREKWLKSHPVNPPQDERKSFDNLERSYTVSDIRRIRNNLITHSEGNTTAHILHQIQNHRRNIQQIPSLDIIEHSQDETLDRSSEKDVENPLLSPATMNRVPDSECAQWEISPRMVRFASTDLKDLDPNLFRRRFVPKYTILDRPIPVLDKALKDYKANLCLGVFQVTANNSEDINLFTVGSFEDFVRDFNTVSVLFYVEQFHTINSLYIITLPRSNFLLTGTTSGLLWSSFIVLVSQT